MVGTIDLFRSNNIAQSLVRNATLAARPNFELQFNQLQNAVIDRLNKTIKEVSADDGLVKGKVDTHLLNEEKRLTRFGGNVDNFIFDNSRNINGVNGLIGQLTELSTALTNNDTTKFNSVLTKINETLGKLHLSNGIAVGIVIPDGIHEIRRDGLISFDNAGTTTKATSRSDFADDAAASAAILTAQTKAARILETLVFKAEGALVVQEKSAKNLNATLLEIQAALVAGEADKAIAIGKVRDQYAQLLNTLSLAFESNQALTDKLATGLFEDPSFDSKSVVSIFA